MDLVICKGCLELGLYVMLSCVRTYIYHIHMIRLACTCTKYSVSFGRSIASSCTCAGKMPFVDAIENGASARRKTQGPRVAVCCGRATFLKLAESLLSPHKYALCCESLGVVGWFKSVSCMRNHEFWSFPLLYFVPFQLTRSSIHTPVRYVIRSTHVAR